MLIVQTANVAPDSALVTFTSLFPFAAPAMLPARMLLAEVPGWQIAAGLLLCVAIAALVTCLAGRVFRNSLLRHGNLLGLRDIRQVLGSG